MTHVRTLLSHSSKIFTALVAAALVFTWTANAQANHEPANKVAAAADTGDVKFLEAPDEDVPLLQTTLRTSKPSELLLNVSAECALWTYVKTVGDDDASARGEIKLWLTKSTNGGDPEVIGVTSTSPGPNEPGETTDDGKVVFCDRMYQRTTSLFEEDEEATIETFMDTRSANAFNWLALNVGSGVHTITLWAEYSEAEIGTAEAQGAVGKRTLIIEPVRAANDEQVVNDLATDE